VSRNEGSMIFIGKGYMYNVFDLGNGRVLKAEKTLRQKLIDTYFYEGCDVRNYLKALAHLMNKKRAIEINRYVQLHVDPEIVGHPTFLEGINYEQDKVELLADVLARLDLAGRKQMVDLYIENILKCWENGFSDTVFNFTINNGLGQNDQIVLIDFNEIVTSREETEKRILTNRWLQSWTYQQLEPVLRRYYREKMDEIVTLDTLNKHWQDH